MQIFIETKCIGTAIRHGRTCAGLKKCDMAKLFGMTTRDYNKVECGKQMWPANMLHRLMVLAFLQLRTRHVNGARTLKPLKNDAEEVQIITAD